MKKFLSSMATLLLLVQVVLPGAVAAQEAEAAGVDTSVSVSTAPSVESSNADNAADSQPSNEGAQSEGQDSVSLSEATKSIEVTEVSETLPSVADAVKNLTDSLTTNLKKATEAIAEGVSAAVDAVKDVLGIETTESEDLPSGAMRAMVVLPSEVNTFTYIFKDGDVVLHKQILKNGEKLAQPATPEKQECKIFEGWFIEEEKVVFGQEVTVNAPQEIIVNAKYKEMCSVTFSYKGKVHATKEVKKGGKTNADGVNYTITDGNLSFSHWSQTENGEAFDFGTQIEKDLTLFLVTKAAYKVVFDSQEGSYLFPVYVDQGGTLTAPTEPTRLGYTFKYWSTQKNGSAFDFSQKINKNLTLYAVWEAKTDTPYKVIYWQENANDDSYSFKEMLERKGTTDENATYDKKSYEGFTFDAADDVTIKADGTSVVNVKYKRKTFNFVINREAFYVRDRIPLSSSYTDWREVSKEEYDTYKLRKKKKTERVKYSETPFKYQQSTASAYDKAVNDYPNYSWYLEKEGTIAYSEAPAMLNRDLTIYGRYAGEYKYIIHYKEQSTNAKIKEDYSFFGKKGLRFTKEDGIDIPGFTVLDLNKWNALGDGDGTIYYTRNSYELSFNTNGGEAIAPQMLPYEAQLTAPANYTSSTLKEVNGVKYSFAGWYDNEALAGEVFSFTGSMPAHNLVLHAKWTSEEHAVTYHTAMVGGTEKILKVEHGKPIGEGILEQPTGEGTFIGWYRKDGQKLIPFPLTEPVLGDLELFPIFDGQTFKVTYVNGPTDNNKYVFMSYAKVLGGVAAPAGKMFLGWKYDGQLYMPNQQVQVKGHVEFTAEFGDAVAQTKVTYSDGKGIQKVFENLVNNGKHVVKNVSDSELNFSKTDHHFIGWKLGITDQIVQPENEVILDTTNQDAENLFIAQWEANEKKENCIAPVPAPANGNYVVEEVVVTWNPATNAWNSVPACSNIKCDEHYTLNGQACEPKQLDPQQCTGLVDNAKWLGQGVVTQVWSGTANAYLPSLTGSYNPDGSVDACDFQCKENYKWNGQACEPKQLDPQQCTGLVDNAKWLGQGVVTQVWSGTANAYLPSLTGSYNPDGSVDACDFQCKSDFTWDAQTKTCKKEKIEHQYCTGLVENAIWGNQEGAMSITQVWSGTANAYLPSLTGSYNPQPSDSACEFKCLDNYTWDAQTQTCKKEKLENQSCTGLVANAQWLGQGVVTQVWSGTANTYLPSLVGSYNPQGDVNACHFKCERDFTRKNGKCEKVSNGGGSSSGGGSSGGGGTLTKDNCPNGDFSPSYYDGQCGTPGDQEEVVLS